MNNLNLLLILFASPLVAAGVGLACGNRKGALVSKLAALGASVAVAAGGLFLGSGVSESFQASCEWVRLGDFVFSFGLLYTPLAAQMMIVVGLVATAVVVFSVRYMRSDEAQGRYFAGISFFVFAMLGITLADNLLALFVFWELVGFCSFLLIGHYGTTEAGAGAKKAFLVNKLGDVLFLLGIIAVLLTHSDLGLTQPQAIVGSQGVWVGLLLLGGVVAKSAQVPLSVWLPDAMVGPTPVSALIHAATMVAAGVYMLCRFDFLFAPVGGLITVVGALTALWAALAAFGQSDLKKVLAYSTVSQLGFMVVGFGLGSPAAAFFHLTTHAFFKSLLFLAAGSVIEGCRHTQQMSQLGGLGKRMPLTAGVFLMGALALAGFPLTAGFFSKDTILMLAAHHSMGLFVVLMAVSLLTALYMGRVIGLVFLGRARSKQAAEAPEENGDFYLVPMVALSLGAIFGGALTFYPAFARQAFWGLGSHELSLPMVLWGLLVCGLGAALAICLGRRNGDATLPDVCKGGVALLAKAFYLDALWEGFGVWVLTPLAKLVYFLNQTLVDGLVTRWPSSALAAVGLWVREGFCGMVTALLYWILGGTLFWLILFNR